MATTPSRKTGEFTVLVDGSVVVKKWLPFVRPADDKVLQAVAAALG